jgi:hypothetical protein
LTLFFVKVSAVDRHRIDADLDSTLHFHADSDPDPTQVLSIFGKSELFLRGNAI